MIKASARISVRCVLVFCIIAILMPRVKAQQLHEKIFVHTDKIYYHTGEIIWFRVYNTDGRNHAPSTISKLVYAEVLDSTNRPLLQGKVSMENGVGNGSFQVPSNAPTGVYVLRAYTNWMKNFSPSLYFQKEIAIVNAANGKKTFSFKTPVFGDNEHGSLLIKAVTSHREYSKRQKVIIELQTADSSGRPLAANLSVSVHKLDSLVPADPVNIYDFLQSVPRITASSEIKFPPEYDGHFINARIIDRNTRQPARSVTGYLTVMDNANSFYNSNSDAAGNIRFLITKLNSADSIIAQTHSFYNRDQQVDVESPFSREFAPRPPSSFQSTDTFPMTMQEQSINAQVNQLYYEEENNHFNILKKDSMPFYYNEDAHYVLDEFTRFSKLEDVFREYIRPVGVTKRQGNFHLTVFNASSSFINERQPLVLVDAVPVFNTDTLFTYDPLKVKTIDVVTNRYFRSGAVFPGIINLTTYRGRTDGVLVDENASVLPYEIVQKERQFYSPSYDSVSDTHLPDFRTLLYWNPSVKSDSSGKTKIEFYTSDLEGEFIINVQGITGEGLCGIVSKMISVK